MIDGRVWIEVDRILNCPTMPRGGELKQTTQYRAEIAVCIRFNKTFT